MQDNQLIPLLPDLASFIVVVDQGSFTAAAKQLNVTPSALSKLISRLEQSLSVKLFERTTRRLQITQTGQKIYDQSLVMFNAAKQAVEMSQMDHDEVSGSITVAAPEAFLNSVLQPHILPFLTRYPELELKLRAVDGHIDLFQQRIDVAFMLTDTPDENLIMKEISKTDLVLCASPEYAQTHGLPTHPQDLLDHQCLYLAEQSNDNQWEFIKDEELHTIEVSGRYAVNQSQLRLKGVLDGLGIGIFHDFVIKNALTQGSVIPVLEDWTIKSNYHGAVAMQYAQTKYMPARLRAFIDYFNEKLTN
ncbi:LysR family transcriptional regulator [Vibrio sp. SCSIO 43136]|uniref:LysR family transcriptional regulator n=1 Tax=Vibrio sp. SCSIO 43136 TaxID=2819101 RepID=UPI0020757F8F|nr:LysR family transcriptional regulator [Vibrio sp. SCSIO 43136]USD68093.1 LysR family transcriptional regulator [Vibrio sp. SCSIO 43136]